LDAASCVHAFHHIVQQAINVKRETIMNESWSAREILDLIDPNEPRMQDRFEFSTAVLFPVNKNNTIQ
jgi:hypothetical protein